MHKRTKFSILLLLFSIISFVNNFSAAALPATDPIDTVISTIKDPDRFTIAARGVGLAPVYRWYGQLSILTATKPGFVLMPDYALNEADPDANLSKWLSRWRAALDRGAPPDEADRDLLRQKLQSTKLSSLSLIDIGRAVNFLSANKELEAEFYAAAAYRAVDELPRVRTSPTDLCDFLLTLNSCRPILWNVIEDNHFELVPALQLLCQSVASWDFTGNAILDRDRYWAQVDQVECCWMLNQTDQGIIIAKNLDRQNLPEDIRFGSDVAFGDILIEAQRYNEAVSYLKHATNSPTYKYKCQAWESLARAYGGIKDVQNASYAFNTWVDIFQPDVAAITQERLKIKLLLGHDLPTQSH